MTEYLAFDLWDEDDFTVDPETKCWMWHRHFSMLGTGFSGALHASIPASRHMRAVRQIYEDILEEPVPPDMDVRGTCPTNESTVIKPCVNPDHHRLVQLQNGARRP